jgi:hypothetical protein
MKRFFLLAAPFLVAVTPASAAIVEVTYSGIIRSGSDMTGIFGAPGADLSGDPYSTVYLFDTTLGTTTTNAAEIAIFGGAVFGTASPSLGAVLTINGHPFSISGQASATIEGFNFAPAITESGVVHDAADGGDPGDVTTIHEVEHVIGNFTGTFPRSLTTPFTNSIASDEGSGSTFEISVQDDATSLYSVLTLGNLEPETVTLAVIPPTATPLPETWPMLLGGIAGAGFLLRGAQRKCARHAQC